MRLKDTKEVKAMIDRMNAQGGGTEVIANPELAGDEAALTGLEVAGTKYKVGGGGGGTHYVEIKGITGDVYWENYFVDAIPEDVITFNKAREDYLADHSITNFCYASDNTQHYDTTYCLVTLGEREIIDMGDEEFEIVVMELYDKGNATWEIVKKRGTTGRWRVKYTDNCEN